MRTRRVLQIKPQLGISKFDFSKRENLNVALQRVLILDERFYIYSRFLPFGLSCHFSNHDLMGSTASLMNACIVCTAYTANHSIKYMYSAVSMFPYSKQLSKQLHLNANLVEREGMTGEMTFSAKSVQNQ